MKVVWPDFVLGLAAMLGSVAYLYGASQIQLSLLSDHVGAGGVPTALGWAMAILGALLCARSALPRIVANANADAQPERTDAASATRPHLLALGLLAILAVYVLITPYLGYAVSTALMVGAVARFCGSPLNRELFIIAAATGVGLWVLFSQVLSISMVVGSLWTGG